MQGGIKAESKGRDRHPSGGWREPLRTTLGVVIAGRSFSGGMEPNPIMKHFFQKKLFIRWASRSRKRFGRAPYLLRQGNGWFVMGFRGVNKHIECRFSQEGSIEVRVYRRRDFHDIVMEYDLYEEKTPDGRWLCRMCRDWPNPDKGEPCRIYEDRAALWIDHSFAPLATWTREFFTPEARLCLCR